MNYYPYRTITTQDDTLIEVKSKSKFPTNRNDWRWLLPEVVPKLQELHKKGYVIVIFTNQAGIEKKNTNEEHIMGKIDDLSAEVSCHYTLQLDSQPVWCSHRCIYSRWYK